MEKKNFMMYVAAMAASLMAVSCTNEDTEMLEVNNAHVKDLTIGTTIGWVNGSRSIQKGTYLPDGSTIGVTVTDADGNSYDGFDYKNVKFTATGEEESQEWNGGKILLSSTEGKAAAYYPYSTGVTDISAIPVETDTQTDYMYSGWVEGLSNAEATVNFSMKHALSAVSVTTVMGTYTGTGKVTAISIASDGFGTEATMNVGTGALAGVKNAGSSVSWSGNYTMTGEGNITELMVVPNGLKEKGVAFTLTVDGKEYTASGTMSEEFKQGYIYNFTLTMNATEMSVSTVSVNEWEITDKGNVVVSPVK